MGETMNFVKVAEVNDIPQVIGIITQTGLTTNLRESQTEKG